MLRLTPLCAALLLILAACQGGGECDHIGSTKECDEGYVCADAGLIGPDLCERLCHTDFDCDEEEHELCLEVEDSGWFVCQTPEGIL